MASRVSGFVGRARFLSALFILFAILLVLRLYFVQIVHSAEYRRDAEGQYVANSAGAEGRESIFFTRKGGERMAAAVMQTGWRLAVNPKEIGDADVLYEKLSRFVELDKERFFASAAKKSDPYEEIAFRIDDETAKKIRAQKLPGVILVQDEWRSYPAKELAAHAVGFVGYRGDKKEGVYGLEAFYDDTLARFSSGLYVNPFAEIFTNLGAAVSLDPKEEKGSIITSIEPQVETHLEEVIRGVVATYSPRKVAGIIMDPRTGEVLAMAASPGFDPNQYNLVDDVSVFGNPLVENVYEMGSIMKPLTMAAGIDSGAVSPKTTYYDSGCIERSGKKICNFDGKARNTVDMQEVLNQSLNVGATFVAEKMGQNVFREYVHAYGLGEKTGIDLPNEATGIIRSVDGHEAIDHASASFGQGIAVTGVEMIRALAALANDGILPSPHLATAIKLESGLIREIKAPQGPRVLKSETVQTVSDMLTEVFDKALLGGVLKQEHYSIAAKTGTAQIALPRGGGYYTDRYLHSFFGYFPAHEPKFIVFLIVLEPHGAEFASATLARPFVDIAKFLINYYDMPPDR